MLTKLLLDVLWPRADQAGLAVYVSNGSHLTRTLKLTWPSVAALLRVHAA
jgi:hypothetical protein